MRSPPPSTEPAGRRSPVRSPAMTRCLSPARTGRPCSGRSPASATRLARSARRAGGRSSAHRFTRPVSMPSIRGPLTRREPPLRASNLRLSAPNRARPRTEPSDRRGFGLPEPHGYRWRRYRDWQPRDWLAHAPERRLPSGQPFLTLRAARATLSAGRTSGPPERRGAWSSFLYLNLADAGVRPHRTPLGAPDPMNTKPTYLSRDGLDKLRSELEAMLSVKRPEVAQRIHDAKEHGDLSENAEYEDAKNEQAFVEGRIQTLQALIKNATIIDENHSTDHVQIGSTVKVESPDGQESFTIVGSTEAKPTEGRISNESPVGRALLGKKKGEKVVVKVPAGDFTYKIVAIT